MNIPKILTPKAMTAYISADDTVRQGLEVMRRHGYTAVPVLGEHGEYIGCITEGDFLWNLIEDYHMDMEVMRKVRSRAAPARSRTRSATAYATS